MTKKLFAFALLSVSFSFALAKEIVIFDASKDANLVSSTGDSKVEKLSDKIKVSYGKHSKPNAGIAIKLNRDFSKFKRLDFYFETDSKTLPMVVVFENASLSFEKRFGYVLASENVKKYDSLKSFTVLTESNEVYDEVCDRQKMRGNPFYKFSLDFASPKIKFDPKNVARARIYMRSPINGVSWSLKKIVGDDADASIAPKWCSMSKKEFFPFIDKYGQFIHNDWKDKIHSDADFKKALKVEAKDLASHKSPTDRNKWGGWESGPKLKATGHFRVEKIDGKWWMVDPDGRLFWSHGVVRVTPHSALTPLDGRKHYFKDLPSADSEFAQFYYTHDELLRPYYEKRNIKETYDYSAANILRKYGKDWKKLYGEIAHKRLRSWGLNTIANSSDKDIFMMGKTPYIDRFEIKSPELAGSDGYWWKFRDPFDPAFRANVRKNLEERKDQLFDPWCIGIFVDNELNWGDPNSHALWTISSSENCFAKKVFASDLQDKYGEIENLNAIWGSKYKSWEDFLKSTAKPSKGSYDDCVKFSHKVIEEYFKVIRNEIKFIAPHMLYMGCRYAGIPRKNPEAILIGAKYCDVLSYNIYRDILDFETCPAPVDKPIMIGEFHFGALDRGKFHTGLVPKNSQEERAQSYFNYVESALKHPNVIGTHWHQFADQATTGRFDGENFQVGFTDVCDTPYWETIEKIREIGNKMYNVRSGK